MKVVDAAIQWQTGGRAGRLQAGRRAHAQLSRRWGWGRVEQLRFAVKFCQVCLRKGTFHAPVQNTTSTRNCFSRWLRSPELRREQGIDSRSRAPRRVIVVVSHGGPPVMHDALRRLLPRHDSTRGRLQYCQCPSAPHHYCSAGRASHSCCSPGTGIPARASMAWKGSGDLPPPAGPAFSS